MEWCQPVMVKSELSCRFKWQSIFLANLWLKMRSGHLLSELLRVSTVHSYIGNKNSV